MSANFSVCVSNNPKGSDVVREDTDGEHVIIFTSEMSVGSQVSHCSLGRLEVLRSRDSSYRTCQPGDGWSHNCNNGPW